jgi:hypothetical protein
VLVNEDATDASDGIANALEELLFVADSPADAAAVAGAKRIFAGLAQGRIDAVLLTANARSYFTKEALGDFQASLAPLGAATDFRLLRSGLRGGLVTRVYEVRFAQKTLRVVERSTPAGLVEQYTVNAM